VESCPQLLIGAHPTHLAEVLGAVDIRVVNCQLAVQLAAFKYAPDDDGAEDGETGEDEHFVVVVGTIRWLYPVMPRALSERHRAHYTAVGTLAATAAPPSTASHLSNSTAKAVRGRSNPLALTLAPRMSVSVSEAARTRK